MTFLYSTYILAKINDEINVCLGQNILLISCIFYGDSFLWKEKNSGFLADVHIIKEDTQYFVPWKDYDSWKMHIITLLITVIEIKVYKAINFS